MLVMLNLHDYRISLTRRVSGLQPADGPVSRVLQRLCSTASDSDEQLRDRLGSAAHRRRGLGVAARLRRRPALPERIQADAVIAVPPAGLEVLGDEARVLGVEIHAIRRDGAS
jgi:hypothetical protein